MRKAVVFLWLVVSINFTSCKNNKETSPKPVSNSSLTKNIPPAEAPAIGLNLGNAAPEISLKNPAGTVINLSSLKGKVVLIDFWASWCGPCRAENPSVVRAFNLYKDKQFKGGKGFTVYSVSLDASAGAWQKAIEKDGLIWDHHVSDLRGWSNEAAEKYGVSAIPVNFLINENGVIINKNLRGEALIEALEKLSQ